MLPLIVLSLLVLGTAAVAVGHREATEPWHFVLASAREVNFFGPITDELTKVRFPYRGDTLKQPAIICSHGAATTPYTSIWSETEPNKPIRFMYGEIEKAIPLNQEISDTPGDNYLYVIRRSMGRSDRILIRKNLVEAFGSNEGDHVYQAIRPVLSQRFKYLGVLEDLAMNWAYTHSREETNALIQKMNETRIQGLRAAGGGVETLPISDYRFWKNIGEKQFPDLLEKAETAEKLGQKVSSVYLSPMGQRLRQEPSKQQKEEEAESD